MKRALLFSLTCFFINFLYADDQGLMISKKVHQMNSSYVGEFSQMEMILRDAYKNEVKRTMEGLFMEVSDDGDRGLITFLTPHDVKGTKMLTWGHFKKADDQWIYLPSLRRVKRISSRNQSSSFMGSEFSYEDMRKQELQKFNHQFLKETKDTWIVEKTPTVKSGYKKQIHYISKKYHQPVKVEYFDLKGDLFKVANSKDFVKFTQGGESFWRANQIHMKNVQTLKESTIIWSERKFGQAFKAKHFNKKYLK